ncbi:MAG: hypothetical protein QOE11_1603 [Solirubrobacteraceae bacterium]|jgi:putative chitinase|nr:hypothetical protein [Solirubrobacteraceae bacterium]
MSEWTISPDALRKVCPNLDGASAATIAKGLGHAFAQYDITTEARAAMAVAQWAHESDHFKTSEEYASGADYQGRLGNIHPGDGKRYKGRGRIMITGRANYEVIAKGLKLDCVERPEMLATSPYSELASGQWWHNAGCNAFCDKGDFVGLTRKINGGVNGLESRQALYAAAKQVAPQLVPRDRMAVLSDSEREQIAILRSERKTARLHGGWEKVDPSHGKRASAAKHWLVDRKAQLTKLAKTEHDGWSKGGRRARVALIDEALEG